MVVILLLGEVNVVLLEQLLGRSNLHGNAHKVTDAAQLHLLWLLACHEAVMHLG